MTVRPEVHRAGSTSHGHAARQAVCFQTSTEDGYFMGTGTATWPHGIEGDPHILPELAPDATLTRERDSWEYALAYARHR